jgi:hypothetical protein
MSMVDLVIRGGVIYDGLGGGSQDGDVARDRVRGEKFDIEYLGH